MGVSKSCAISALEDYDHLVINLLKKLFVDGAVLSKLYSDVVNQFVFLRMVYTMKISIQLK